MLAQPCLTVRTGFDQEKTLFTVELPIKAEFQIEDGSLIQAGYPTEAGATLRRY